MYSIRGSGTMSFEVKRNGVIEGERIIIIMYLYSAQYLHILQDSKRYLTNPIVQVQPQLTSPSLEDRGSRMTIYQHP